MAQVDAQRISRDQFQHNLNGFDRLTQQKRREQVLARLPVQVDRSFRDPRQPRDIVHGGLFIAPTLNQLGGGIQNAMRPLLPLCVLALARSHSLYSYALAWQRALLLAFNKQSMTV